MRGSLRIARLAGINVFVHWTFIFLILWVTYSSINRGGDTFTVIVTILLVLAVFACVTLHELGHALAARRYNIDTKDITLLPIGGVARLKSMPEDPWQELIVAVAGPLVNVVIAIVLCLLFMILWDVSVITDSYESADEGAGFFVILRFVFIRLSILDSPDIFVLNIVLLNIFLVVFNAIPAFPMDGGRVFRALLSMKMDRVQATSIAARLGQILAIVFAFFGFFSYNPFLILIGLFVFFGASAEQKMVLTTSMLQGHTVKDIIRTRFTTLSTNDSIDDVKHELLAGADQDFIVFDEQGVVAGVLKRSEIMAAISRQDPSLKVKDIMITGIPTLQSHDDINKVYEEMVKENYKILPVFENGKFIGVLDEENISEFLMMQTAARKS